MDMLTWCMIYYAKTVTPSLSVTDKKLVEHIVKAESHYKNSATAGYIADRGSDAWVGCGWGFV